jgi:AcrR family transcriptional regulator
MSGRAAAVEQTRRRILEATMAEHAERGILATSIQDVARRADVAVGTVYRHFPTLEELVAACGALSFEMLPLPSPEEVVARFHGARSRGERVERLVDAVAGVYAPAAIAFLRVREARDELRPAAEGHAVLEGAIDSLVDEALRPLDTSAQQAAAVRSLLDARFWMTLLDRGLDGAAAHATLVTLVGAALRR